MWVLGQVQMAAQVNKPITLQSMKKLLKFHIFKPIMEIGFNHQQLQLHQELQLILDLKLLEVEAHGLGKDQMDIHQLHNKSTVFHYQIKMDQITMWRHLPILKDVLVFKHTPFLLKELLVPKLYKPHQPQPQSHAQLQQLLKIMRPFQLLLIKPMLNGLITLEVLLLFRIFHKDRKFNAKQQLEPQELGSGLVQLDGLEVERL